MYDGVKSEVLNITKFDENSDLSTTHLGRLNMTRLGKIKAEDKFPISDQGYTVGKLLGSTECQILLDMEVSKSFMPKSHYLRCKSLHSLPYWHPNLREFKWEMENMLVCYLSYQ